MTALVKTIGIVLFRRLPRGRQYLLLHHRGRYWNFPKGRAEVSDAGNELTTAFRELGEETGVPQAAVRVLAGFRATYRYHFTAAAAGRVEHVSKLAVCYLGELIRDCPVTISHEHLGWAWYDPATAWQRLYYANGRHVLAAAEAFLSSALPRHQRRVGTHRSPLAEAPRGARPAVLPRDFGG